MSTQHTPTPWVASSAGIVGNSARDNVVCEAPIHYLESSKKWDANAAFIVRSCNAHDALVSALSDLEDIFDGQEDCDDGVPNDAMRAMTIIRDALAKAGAA